MMNKVLISACLLGERVRYDGKIRRSRNDIIRRWVNEGRVVSICPEVFGGLPVPRPAAEITGGGGSEVLAGRAGVINTGGVDVTENFLTGARHTLDVARVNGIRVAIMKNGSPSCGSTYIYDGSFSGLRSGGEGVTTALLRKSGIHVFNENEFEAADARIRLIDD